jgi:hypothetical protein
MGVLKPGGEPDLREQALGPHRQSDLGVEHLERDRTLVLAAWAR